MAPMRPSDGPATRVCLGLGSNLGDRLANLEKALGLMAAHIEVLAVSAVYETAPWGYLHQPHYLNCACLATTSVTPPELLSLAQEVEKALGRQPTFRCGPRTMDVDILLYGEQSYRSATLEIPHPGLAQRAFALVPLAEVAPGAFHPVLREAVATLAARVVGRETLKLWAPPIVLASPTGQL